MLEKEELAAWCAPLRMARNLLDWKRAKPALRECRRIVVIRPDEIGDVLLTSAFFRSLRKSAPAAHITAITNEICRPLLENCPYVDLVLALPFKPTIECEHRALLVVATIKLKLARLCRGFDLVLLPRGDADWYNAELVGHLLVGRGSLVSNTAAFIEWTIKPPESPRLADWRYEVVTPQSDVLSNLEFLSWCGGEIQGIGLEFWTAIEDESFAKNWLGVGKVGSRKLVFHPPSGSHHLKRWPMGRSQKFILRLLAETDFEVIIIGGPGEEWVRNEISSINNPRIRLAFNAFNLTKLGAVIRECGYFVGGDSGPMHIAAAVGAKVLGIFGYASETRFRPWSENAEVVSLRYHCSPDQRGTYEANCQKCIYPENRCLTELSVDKVMSEIQSFFCEDERVVKRG